MDPNDLTDEDWNRIEQAIKFKRHDSEEWYELYEKIKQIET